MRLQGLHLPAFAVHQQSGALKGWEMHGADEALDLPGSKT